MLIAPVRSTAVPGPHSSAILPREWRIDPKPLLDISGDEGGAGAFGVVCDAARLSDGRVVVMDGSTMRLSYYDSGGKFLRTATHKGQGPGDFEGCGQLSVIANDSVVASDVKLHRISIFDPEMRFERVVSLASLTSMTLVEPLIARSDRTVIVRSSDFTNVNDRRDNRKEGAHLYRVRLADGALVDSLGVFPNLTLHYLPMGKTPAWRVPLIGGHMHIESVGSKVFVSDPLLYRILRIDLVTHRVDTLTRTWPVQLVTEAMAVAERAAAVRRGANASLMATIPAGDTVPAIRGIVADPEGNLMVQEYRASSEDLSYASIFDASGKWMCRLPLPRRFRPMHLGADWVVGVVLDDDDVQRVRVYHITKT